ncbi:hypothetical protein ABPG72_009700 [Tetrahymena utriculariae]
MLKITKVLDFSLECLNDVNDDFSLIPIYQLKQLEEQTLLKQWPPFCEQTHEYIINIKQQIKQLMQEKESQLEIVNSWFDQFTDEKTKKLLRKKIDSQTG